jgi:hypothetical protein
VAISLTCCRYGMFDAFGGEVVVSHILVIVRKMALQLFSAFVRIPHS